MISNRITYVILGMKQISIEASKHTLTDQIVDCISRKFSQLITWTFFETQVMENHGGQDCKGQWKLCINLY